MEFQADLQNLCLAQDPDGAVVSLALDLSKARAASAERRVTLIERMLHWMSGEEHSPEIRAILRGISSRLSLYFDRELSAQTQGLFLVAGPGLWRPFEFGVPIPDFLHVGRKAYLAPLMEAFSRTPRAYVLRFDRLEGILEEVWRGIRREIGRFPSALIERDAQHQMSGHSTRSHAGAGRSATRTGGGGRDRFQHCVEDSVGAMLHKAADHVAGLQREAPSESILAFGDRMHFPLFRNRLPASLRSQVVHVGPVPHRHELLLEASIREKQELRVRNRVQGEILEFQARRAERCHTALEAEVILPLLATGRVARVFLDPRNPLPGKKCETCVSWSGVGPEKCKDCGSALTATSLTQEVIAYVLRRPSVPVTFVSSGAAWLEECDGLAALLSDKGCSLAAAQ